MMTSRLDLRQPLMLSVVLLVALSLASYGLRTNPAVNLWSLRYLRAANNSQGITFNAMQTETPPPSHTNGYIWQARQALESNRPLQAMQLLQPALQENSTDAHRLLAEIYAMEGQYQNAIKLWSSLADVDSLLAAGEQAIQEKRSQDALLAYTYAYKIIPERVVLSLANYYRQEANKPKDAEALLRQYIVEYPHSRYLLSWLNALAALYRNTGSLNEAATINEQLLVLAPDRVDDWIELGWIYYERGDGVGQAMAQFQQAIQIMPQEGKGYYAIASLLNRENRFAEADYWYLQAIQRDPEQRGWYLSRALALQEADQLTNALQVYAIIQKRFPDFANGYYQAAWAYRQAEQMDAAKTAIERAIALLDRKHEATQTQAAYYGRSGQIYENMGLLQSARAAYETAAQLDPTRQDVQNGLARLR